MKLGIIRSPKGESLHEAKALGLDFVEFDCNPTDYFGVPMAQILPEQEAIARARDETGVEIGAVGRWASHILTPTGETDPGEWAEVRSLMDFGAALGAKYYLCSVAYVPELTYYRNITAAIRVLRDIVAEAGERGMTCAIVNCMMGDNYIRTPEQWRLILDEVPGLGIKYDPSHSFVHGGERGAYLAEAMAWGGRFKYCHIKGVIQTGDSREPDHWARYELFRKHPELREIEELQRMDSAGSERYDNPPAGIDAINWPAFFAALYQHDFDGYLSIEPHSATWQGEKGDKGLKYTIRYLRQLML